MLVGEKKSRKSVSLKSKQQSDAKKQNFNSTVFFFLLTLFNTWLKRRIQFTSPIKANARLFFLNEQDMHAHEKNDAKYVNENEAGVQT